MNKYLIIVVLAGFFGVVEAETCETMRMSPDLYETMMNQKGVEILGKIKVVAITHVGDSRKDTNIFIKSEAAGEPDIYMLQQINKDCEITSQLFYLDPKEVKQIIKQRGMKKL